MAEAAVALLDGLDATQRTAATWPFPPPMRGSGGLHPDGPWRATAGRHVVRPASADPPVAVDRLVDGGIRRRGDDHGPRERARLHRGMEVVLRARTGPGPVLYWYEIFGEPGADSWGWRLGGHHISISHTIDGGEVVALSPLFFGADPASAPLLGPHPLRPLAGVEEVGRGLVRSLPADQLPAAWCRPSPRPTSSATTGPYRATAMRCSDCPTLPGRFEAELDQRMHEMQRAAEVRPRPDRRPSRRPPPHHPAQGRAGCGSVGRQPEHAAKHSSICTSTVSPTVWPTTRRPSSTAKTSSRCRSCGRLVEPGEPHYYRIQGADLLVEYDNTQRGVNHVHAVCATFRRDFGRDAVRDPLADHYTTGHHNV